MECVVKVQDKHIVSEINVPDGVYSIRITPKGTNKTYEQVKKLWATISDISRELYGNVSQTQSIYFQILRKSGVSTDEYVVRDEAIKDFTKKFRTYEILGKETINHKPYSVIRVCLKGLSEMSKQEASQVIETTLMWCAELGINTDIERW